MFYLQDFGSSRSTNYTLKNLAEMLKLVLFEIRSVFINEWRLLPIRQAQINRAD